MPLRYATLASFLLLIGCSANRATTDAHHPGTGAKGASSSAALEYNGSVTLVRVK
jgi:hypothetical protein